MSFLKEVKVWFGIKKFRFRRKKSEFSSKNKLNSYWPLPPRGIIFACFAYVNDQFWLPPVTSDIFIVFAIRYAFPTKMFFGIWFSEALFCWAFGTETGALLQLANIQVMVMRFWIKAILTFKMEVRALTSFFNEPWRSQCSLGLSMPVPPASHVWHDSSVSKSSY